MKSRSALSLRTLVLYTEKAMGLARTLRLISVLAAPALFAQGTDQPPVGSAPGLNEIPEPSTWMTALIGLSALAAYRYYRSRK